MSVRFPAVLVSCCVASMLGVGLWVAAPLAAAEDERPQAHSPSVIPGSVKAASRIPRAPAVPKSMVPIAFEELPAEEPVKPAKNGKFARMWRMARSLVFEKINVGTPRARS